MAEMKHLVVAKFKHGVAVQDIIKGMEDLVSSLDHVSSFEWGEDLKSEEMLRQGFTHAFIMTFSKEEDFKVFVAHPKHLDFSAVFSTAIDNVLVLDFPAALVKPKPEADPLPAEADPQPANELPAAYDSQPPADPPAA
ncbi:hypothetical protein V2J09_020937 [Rumex salicifolius]